MPVGTINYTEMPGENIPKGPDLGSIRAFCPCPASELHTVLGVVTSSLLTILFCGILHSDILKIISKSLSWNSAVSGELYNCDVNMSFNFSL